MSKLNQAMNDMFRYNSAILPQKRSTFDKSHSHATTFDSGYLIPVMWDRVVPGDEKQIKVSALARLLTPLNPVMDQANLDIWAFYVPDRLWWEHAKEFYGENNDADFNDDPDLTMPFLYPYQWHATDQHYSKSGMLSDYFGFPVLKDTCNWESYKNTTAGKLAAVQDGMVATAGLHRCYQRIWNDYFRNSAVSPALQLSTDDEVTDAEWSVISQLRKVTRYPDYFTTLLLKPAAGDPVLLPLGEWAPVVSRDVDITENGSVDDLGMSIEGTKFKPFSSDVFGAPSNGMMAVHGNSGVIGTYGAQAPSSEPLAASNLWANLTYATSATINNLRSAITVNQLLEISALAGNRYQSQLYWHFGVLTPAGLLQMPELLGCSRTEVGMRQVLSTANVNDDSPLGKPGAVSVTNLNNEWICNKSFTEPGFIMVLAAVRPVTSYSQGLNCLLTKLQRYDHYYPVFDNLGNQPVFKKEIVSCFDDYMQTPEYALNDVLGYKEAWSEYRVMANRVSGLMRPDVHDSLASWNYSIKFDHVPSLDNNFVLQGDQEIDRTIIHQNEPQFLLDVYFDYKDTKNMAVHSIPGLTRL